MTDLRDSLFLPAVTFAGNALQQTSGTQQTVSAWVVRGLFDTWAVRGEDTVLPTAVGRVARDRKRDHLIIELAGFVMGYGGSGDDLRSTQRENVVTLMNNVKGYFDPSQNPGSLVIADPDGVTTWTITARPLNLIWREMNEGQGDPVYQPFSVELVAVGADWVNA